MTTKEALKLIKSLACLRDYPKGYPDAEAKLADRLMQASGGELKLATAIIGQFEEKSPTLADISEVARQIRGRIAEPEGDREFGRGFKDYGEKPKIQCTRCEDQGFFVVSGQYVWCNCQAGAEMQKACPTMIDDFQKLFKKRPMPKLAMIERPAEALQPVEPGEISRCEKCRGLGKFEDGGYCDCVMGRDLERGERKWGA